VLSLEQVIELFYDVLRMPDIEAHPGYPHRYIDKLAIIRAAYIEHCAFPELSITSMIRRQIMGVLTVEESAFWKQLMHRAIK